MVDEDLDPAPAERVRDLLGARAALDED